jgi:hypothetical protein
MEGIQIIKYEPVRAALKTFHPMHGFCIQHGISISKAYYWTIPETYKKGLNYTKGHFVQSVRAILHTLAIHSISECQRQQRTGV